MVHISMFVTSSYPLAAGFGEEEEKLTFEKYYSFFTFLICYIHL
jgi:hypothetical protein